MGAKGKALASEFEAATAHHIAGSYEPITRIIKTIAAGEATKARIARA